MVVNGILFTLIMNTIVCITIFMILYPSLIKVSILANLVSTLKSHLSSNTDIGKTIPDGQNPDRKVFVKKTSAAKSDKMHVKRTQQVWVLKNSN